MQMDHLKPPTPSDGYELLLAAAPQPMQQKVMRAVDLMKVIKRAAHDDSTWNEDALNEVIFSLQSNTIERQVDELKREIGKKKRTLGSGKTPVRLWLDELRVDYQLLEYLKRIETWKRTAPVPTADASTFPKVTSDKSQEDQNNEFLIHVTRECLDTDLSLKVEAALKAQGAPRATSIEQLEGIISMVEDTHNAGKAANSNLTDLTKTFSVFLDAQTGPKCALCKNSGHMAAACPDTCFTCNMPGHWAKYCPRKRDDRSVCPQCNSTDHWASQPGDCPNKDKSSSRNNNGGCNGSNNDNVTNSQCTFCGRLGH